MKCIIFYGVGFNKYETTINHGNIHAEVDALLKLPYQQKPKKISLGIFTTNKQGTILRMSKCCINCERSIQIICKKKKYIIKHIYYIDEEGQLQIL
jgi:hypothetical protein